MHDIIIIGSGVAGSFIASKLKKFDVLVIEKDKEIKIKDSGIVSNGIFDFFHGNKLIKEKINSMDIVSQNKTLKLEAKKPFANILEREGFSEFLRSKIEDKTAFETAREIECSEGFITIKTNEHTYNTKMLIGADGANSLVRKAITDETPKLCTGIMNTTDKQLNTDSINIYFNKYFSPDFFSWQIPQNNEYGLLTAIRPMEYYDYFKRNLELPNGTIRAGLIPIGTTKSYANRILLVGDACGQVKPLTGGGIIYSLKAATHAIETIKDAFEEDKFDEENLRYYEWAWKRDFGSEIKRELFARNIYRKMTNPEIDRLICDFGPQLQRAINKEDFNYDTPASLWTKMPKFKLLKFLIEHYILDR